MSYEFLDGFDRCSLGELNERDVFVFTDRPPRWPPEHFNPTPRFGLRPTSFVGDGRVMWPRHDSATTWYVSTTVAHSIK